MRYFCGHSLKFLVVFLFLYFLSTGSVFAAPAPSVNSISPTSGSTAGGIDVTIGGTGFAAGTLTIGGGSVTNLIIVSSTEMTATTPSGTAGAQDVVYTRTSDGKSGTLVGGFTYTTPPSDTTAPSAVNNLTALGATQTSINLSWTAPGDDAGSGTTTTYDVRYSTSNITNDTDFNNATQVTGEPTPSVAGSSESMTVSGLSANTTYYFAIKVSDEVPNTSSLSNVPSEATTVTNGSGGQPSISTPTGGGVAPTRVLFSGKAFPRSEVEVLFRDDVSDVYRNVPLSTYNISSSGEFNISYTAFLTGRYFFSIRAIDKMGQKTGSMSFNVDFNSEKSLVARDILFPPTINFGNGIFTLDKNIKIFGYSTAGSAVKIEVGDIIKEETKANNNGYYEFILNPSNLGAGDFQVRVGQTNKEGKDSGFSFPRSFRVSSLSFPKADFNKDNSINVVDWSMFLFRWGSKEKSLRREIDLDGNGKIDIIDFSIFLKNIKI